MFQTKFTGFSSAEDKSMNSTVGGFEHVPPCSCIVSVLYMHTIMAWGSFLLCYHCIKKILLFVPLYQIKQLLSVLTFLLLKAPIFAWTLVSVRSGQPPGQNGGSWGVGSFYSSFLSVMITVDLKCPFMESCKYERVLALVIFIVTAVAKLIFKAWFLINKEMLVNQNQAKSQKWK